MYQKYLITDNTRQPLNIFESAIKVMKNSASYNAKTANDPLGAATLASFFAKSGQHITQTEGFKYQAELVTGNDITREQVLT